MVTVWQLMSKYSTVVYCVLGAHDVPGSFTWELLCQWLFSKGFSYSFLTLVWPFFSCLFPLTPSEASTGKWMRKQINGIEEAKERQELNVHCTQFREHDFGWGQQLWAGDLGVEEFWWVRVFVLMLLGSEKRGNLWGSDTHFRNTMWSPLKKSMRTS